MNAPDICAITMVVTFGLSALGFILWMIIDTVLGHLYPKKDTEE